MNDGGRQCEWSVNSPAAEFYSTVIIRSGANVQDGALIHGPEPTEIGAVATVEYNAVVHGAVLEDECLIANDSVVLDGARFSAGWMIAASGT